MKTISVLLVFVLLAGFVPFQQPGYADAAINTMEDLRSNAGTAEDDNETITLRFASGNYVFNATVEIPEEKNVVILADGSDVCFSHGAFSGEMFFVPETSSLKIAGYNDDPASPIKFTNTYSLEDLIQAEAPAVEEVPEEEIQEIPEDPSFDGESGNGLGGSEGEYYEDGEELNVYEETLTEVFVKSFSTLALVGEPVNLRAIVAEGPLSLEYVSFEGFVAPAGLSGAAVSLESGSSENSEFRFVKFKNCKDSENYALCIDGGRTLFMENVSADGNCRIKNKDGNVTVSSIEIGDIIDGGFEVKAEEIVEEVVEEPEEIVEEVVEEPEEIVEEVMEEPEEIVEEVIEEPEEIVEEVIEEPEEIVEEVVEEPEEIVEEIIEEPKEIVEEIIEKPEVIAEEVKEEPKEIVLENPQPETPQEQKNPQPVVSAPQEEKKVDVTTPSAPKTEAPANNNQRVSISVSWDSNGNKAVNQPEKVTVRMKKNDADYKSAELSSANGWKTEFEIDDPMAKYAVEQDPVSGFETTYQADNNSIHITNTAEKEQFLTSVLNLFTPKKEEKLQSSANTVDSSAETAELGDSHEVVEVTVTSGSENNTQETQNTEQNAQQQQTVQSYIDNAPKQSIIVSANWTDNNNSARRRPGKTQVSLYLNNSLYMNATLSADNNWTYTFSNLTPGYSYRVEQSSVADYSTSYWTSGNTVYISNQYTGAQPGSSTTQQNVQQGYNNPQNAVNNQQTQYPNNAVQSTSAPTVNVTPAPAATASPVPTQVPVFSPVPTRTPVTVPTSEPIETENQGSSHAWIWIVLLVVSAGAIAAVLISMNKAKKQREAQEAARERARKRAAEAEIRKAQADISEGVRRTQNAERTAQRARQTQSREAYSGSQYRDSERSRYRDSERSQYRGSDRTQYRDADRSTYRNDAQRREAPRESSRDTEYRPKH